MEFHQKNRSGEHFTKSEITTSFLANPAVISITRL
jgi:hypothetical protein